MKDVTIVGPHVMEWFELASENAECAVLLSNRGRFRKQALYMTQQSMEAATKGMASDAGVSYREILKHGHNNLHIILLVFQKYLDTMPNVDHINDVLSSHSANNEPYDAAAKISNILNLTSDPRNREELSKSQKESATQFYDSMRLASVHDVDSMLQLLSKLRTTLMLTPNLKSLIEHISNTTFIMDPCASYENIAKSLAGQVIDRRQSHKTSRLLNKVEVALFDTMCQHMMNLTVDREEDEQFRSELKANNGEFTFSSSSFISVVEHSLNVQLIHLGIIIVGSLVWPHESSPRYPPDPDAPDSAGEAVAQRKMGARHYTNDLGVIKCIKKLSREAQTTTNLLKKSYKLARQ